MKGQNPVIDCLNDLLADELTAINQYMVHAEMCESWRYGKLHEVIQKRAVDEMHHAEKLIERILFLEGRPTVTKLNQVTIGADVEKMLHNDRSAEMAAVEKYNKGIKLTAELADNGTRELLQSILLQEEDHLDLLEAQLDQIAQLGIQAFLSEHLD